VFLYDYDLVMALICLLLGVPFVLITFDMRYSYLNTLCMPWLYYGLHLAHNKLLILLFSRVVNPAIFWGQIPTINDYTWDELHECF
jgi:hypothetical protein